MQTIYCYFQIQNNLLLSFSTPVTRTNLQLIHTCYPLKSQAHPFFTIVINIVSRLNDFQNVLNETIIDLVLFTIFNHTKIWIFNNRVNSYLIDVTMQLTLQCIVDTSRNVWNSFQVTRRGRSCLKGKVLLHLKCQKIFIYS